VDTPPGQRFAERAARHVLVVDDDAVNRMLLVRMLEVLDISADTAEDGLDAVRALTAREYAAVLMDVQMPRQDGVETTIWLRAHERSRRTPVIAVSGADLPADRRRCVEAGMDGFIAKPIDMVELRDVLAGHVPMAAELDLGDVVEASRLADLADQLGDLDVVHDVVRTYLAELPGRRTTLDTAVRSLDRDNVRLIAHSLKSASALVGATSLSGSCAELEKLAAEATPADLRACLDRIEELAPETATTLERWLEVS
jgi:two-component system sensor histidine kinase/response regulator